MKCVQQEFNWSERPDVSKSAALPQPLDAHEVKSALPTSSACEALPIDSMTATASVEDAAYCVGSLPAWDQLPIPTPLREAVDQGVFGVTEDGAFQPDEDDVRSITEEHARELIAILAEAQGIEDALRAGQDPRTGRSPKTEEAARKLTEFLEREDKRLKTAYGNALAAYVQGFGEQATALLDLWVRKNVADCVIQVGRYDPGHPWHYFHEGDNAPPIPVDEIDGDIEIGSFIDRDLPKNKSKRIQRMREFLAEERHRVEQDKRRYQEVVEKGADALSRYDREIAHTSDEMARATALALKFSHIRFGLGRVAWLEKLLASEAPANLLDP